MIMSNKSNRVHRSRAQAHPVVESLLDALLALPHPHLAHLESPPHLAVAHHTHRAPPHPAAHRTRPARHVERARRRLRRRPVAD